MTQSEEVAGLLLGYKDLDAESGKWIVTVHSSVTHQRKTKEKDRVEIDAMQLYETVNEAEEMGKYF